MTETKTVRKDDIKTRRIRQDYIDCPHCGEEINDNDATLVGDIDIECPHCNGKIYIEK